MHDDAPVPAPSYRALFRRFLGLGGLAWGGPVAQIGMLQKEFVDDERWISKDRFYRALAVYQALPGPEATELCVYLGMVVRGRIGAVLAGLGFILPGFLLMFLIAWLYFEHGLRASLFAGAFFAMQPAAAALVVRAVHRVAVRALRDFGLLVLAIFSFVGAAAGAPFWLPLVFGGAVHTARRSGKLNAVMVLSLLYAGLCARIWYHLSLASAPPPGYFAHALPSALDLTWSGLRAGLLTFGGAYTAIPFVRNDAVVTGGWMSETEFLDAIALSGILPAPLIIFGTFVGYAGGGPAGAFLMTAGIFLPAFLFTLLGHDILERAVENPKIHAFLEGVTAAVTGIIAFAAVTLVLAAVQGGGTAAIFFAALLVLYATRHKLAVLAVMLGAALIGLVFF